MIDPQTQGDVQWALGALQAVLDLEVKALREDEQRSDDDYMTRIVPQVSGHLLVVVRLLRTLQAHVGPPPPPRRAIYDMPTNILGPSVPLRPTPALAPIDDDEPPPPTTPRRRW